MHWFSSIVTGLYRYLLILFNSGYYKAFIITFLLPVRKLCGLSEAVLNQWVVKRGPVCPPSTTPDLGGWGREDSCLPSCGIQEAQDSRVWLPLFLLDPREINAQHFWSFSVMRKSHLLSSINHLDESFSSQTKLSRSNALSQTAWPRLFPSHLISQASIILHDLLCLFLLEVKCPGVFF